MKQEGAFTRACQRQIESQRPLINVFGKVDFYSRLSNTEFDAFFSIVTNQEFDRTVYLMTNILVDDYIDRVVDKVAASNVIQFMSDEHNLFFLAGVLQCPACA